jgi:hypothetical protein
MCRAYDSGLYVFGLIKRTRWDLPEDDTAANAAAAVRNRKFPAEIANFTESVVKTETAWIAINRNNHSPQHTIDSKWLLFCYLKN